MNESNNDLTSMGIEAASAHALAAVQGDGLITARAALEELTRRNKALLDGGDDAIIDALGRQAVVLEALFYKLLVNAEKAMKPDVTAMALKAAFSSQRALLTTLGAIHQMRHA